MTFSAVKDPDAILDYRINWEEVMNSTDPVDTIVSSSWSFDTGKDAGMSVDADSYSTTDTTAWVSSGTLNQLGKLVNIITTAGGRTHVRTINISIKDT